MARFRRLTDAEARTLTRRQILDRVEAEQRYWFRGRRAEADPAGYAEFSRIMHAYLDPIAGIDAALATLRGEPSGYWESTPS